MTIGNRYDLKSVLLIVFYLSAAAGLIILAVTAFRWSMADVYAIQVSYHLRTLNGDSSNKDVKQWRLARQQLDKVLELRPNYESHLELAENFYQKLDTLELKKNPLIYALGWRDNERKALDYARSGLRLAPSWPYLWSKLMISKLMLRQFDSEMAGAIERAQRLGPWERSVQYRVALAGVSYWPFLQEVSHPYVLQALEQTFAMSEKNPSKQYDLKPMLSRANFLQICEEETILATQRLLRKYCR